MEEKNEHLHGENPVSCGCGHCHCEKSSGKNIESSGFISQYGFEILKIGISAVFIIIALIFKFNPIVKLVLFAFAAVTVGYDLVYKCIKDVIKGTLFNEQTLMIVASVVAFILGESFEGAFIVFLYTIGEFLEEVATDNSKKKIAGLSELKSAVAHLITKDGSLDVLPEEVQIGSLIEIRRGERIPIDGVLLYGSAELDVKAITGESKYSSVESGDKIFSGAINVGDPIVIKTEKLYKDSTVEQIISMVEGATAKKAKSQKFITSFAKIYTPIVAIATLLIALIPPLFDQMNFNKWIYKGLSFLVISCPCALVISVPLAFFVGIGSMAKRGILVKGSSFLESLTKIDTAVFDKTGTLTKGNFKVVETVTEKYFDENVIKAYASALESNSNHPLSKAVVSAFGKSAVSVENVKEIAGQGLSGIIENKNILIGNDKLMKNNGVEFAVDEFCGTVLYVALDKKFAAKIFVADEIKSNCKESLAALRKMGIKKLVMLSGDKKNIAEKVADETGIDTVYAELMPEEKVETLKNIKNNIESNLLFAGDGINDSPSLALADVGVAMGGLGSEIAVESSDVVIMDDDLGKISLAIKGAKKIKRTVIQNIVGSLVIKFAVMILSLIITLPVWIAMFADVGCMLLAVLNSLKNGKIKN